MAEQDDEIEKAWREQYPMESARLDEEATQTTSSNIFDAQDLRDVFGHGYRAALASQQERHAAELQAARAESRQEARKQLRKHIDTAVEGYEALARSHPGVGYETKAETLRRFAQLYLKEATGG